MDLSADLFLILNPQKERQEANRPSEASYIETYLPSPVGCMLPQILFGLTFEVLNLHITTPLPLPIMVDDEPLTRL